MRKSERDMMPTQFPGVTQLCLGQGTPVWLCDADVLSEPGAETEAVQALERCGLQERVATADRYKRAPVRHLSLAAGLALAAALSAEGIRSAHFSLATGPCGKPFLPDYPHIHFSLSHSGHYGLCALGREEIGADIQRLHHCDLPLAERFFHPAETAALRQNPTDRYFTTLWTRKEAWLKWRGVGLTEEMSSFSVLDPVALHCRFDEGDLDDHLICVCRAP
ncbi:MAG: 4'-phosphopantetheinyl transferase superfamily protein [Butyrivibrio sp.]|nr:4'-phosphopantetheinyl transferase superfamily protein [Butyrivibrio sp.]